MTKSKTKNLLKSFCVYQSQHLNDVNLRLTFKCDSSLLLKQITVDVHFFVRLFYCSVQDQRVGEPENHRSSSRQSAGPAVRHVRGATGSTPTKQQTGQPEVHGSMKPTRRINDLNKNTRVFPSSTHV